MDAVILAAGRNGRMRYICAPYHKPLLVVRGEPLVRRAVAAAKAAGTTAVTVVVAPENASQIAAVIGYNRSNDDVRMVIQRRPAGPGDALLVGMEVGRDEDVLVLLGDNYVTDEDVSKVASHPEKSASVIGIRRVPPEKAIRFAYYEESSARWVEKVPTYDHETAYVEAWCGPIRVKREQMRALLKTQRWTLDELTIGETFNHLTDLRTVLVESWDVSDPNTLDAW